MTAEIRDLKGKLQPAAAEPDRKVIEQLEVALERARKGYIQGVIMVTDEQDGSTGTMRMGVMSYAMVGRLNELIRNTLIELDD